MRYIIPGNSSSLWRAVKVARDVDMNDLPRVLFEGGVEVEKKLWPDRFAEHFDKKIKDCLGKFLWMTRSTMEEGL